MQNTSFPPIPVNTTQRRFCSAQVQGQSKVKLKQLQQVMHWGLIFSHFLHPQLEEQIFGALCQKYSIFQLTGKKLQCLFPGVLGLLYPQPTAQPDNPRLQHGTAPAQWPICDWGGNKEPPKTWCSSTGFAMLLLLYILTLVWIVCSRHLDIEVHLCTLCRENGYPQYTSFCLSSWSQQRWLLLLLLRSSSSHL